MNRNFYWPVDVVTGQGGVVTTEPARALPKAVQYRHRSRPSSRYWHKSDDIISVTSMTRHTEEDVASKASHARASKRPWSTGVEQSNRQAHPPRFMTRCMATETLFSSVSHAKSCTQCVHFTGCARRDHVSFYSK